MQYVEFEQTIVVNQVPVLTIWLDGSFVSKKDLPNDLDMVWFIEATYPNSHHPTLDQVRNRYPLLHSLLAEHHPANSANGEAINKIEKFNWFSLFSSKNRKPKGFIELRIDR